MSILDIREADMRRMNESKVILTVAIIQLVGMTHAWAAGPLGGTAEKKEQDPGFYYKVKSGDSLSLIAETHGVTLDDLMQANEMTNPDRIDAGAQLIIPGDPKDGRLTSKGVVLKIPKGFTLSRIADLYKMKVRTIIRANRIKNPDRIRDGHKLLIPGAKSVVRLVPPPPCLRAPVTIYRIRNDQTIETSLVYCNGHTYPEGLATLSEFTKPIGKEMPFLLNKRVPRLLQLVAEKFPGRRIEVVSGQRTVNKSGNESHHCKGEAIDFRVAGIPREKLVKFLRTVDRVGVGYYPNSVFVHMDTRDENAYWVDYSKPGEQPIYARSNSSKEKIEKIRKKRKTVGDKVAMLAPKLAR